MTPAFPATRHSVLDAVCSADGEVRRTAFDVLITAYWQPVRAYLAARWRLEPADADDLTQEFFARAMEKDFFASYDPARARFRTFLRTCVDGFAAKAHRDARRLKRGGAAPHVALEDAGALAAATEHDLDALFHREFARRLFTLSVDDLRAACEAAGKPVVWSLFRRYDVEGPDAATPPSYAGLAAEYALPVTQVTNHLAWARRTLRGIVLDRLRGLCGSDEEFRAEARALLGVDPP